MRAYAAVLAAVLAVAVPARAENNEEGPDGPPRMQEPELLSDKLVEKLDDRLKLSAKQKEGIKAALAESRPALKAKWEEKKALMEKMRALQKDMRSLMRDSKEKIRSLLDPEQREKYDDMMAEMRRRRPGMGGPGGGMMMRPGGPRKRFEGEGGRGGMREGDDMPPPEMWHDKMEMRKRGDDKEGD